MSKHENLIEENMASLLAVRLRKLMRSRQMNGNELADYVGIPRSTVNRYLNENRVPKLNYIVQIAERFNVSIDWLLGYSTTEMRDDVWAPEARELVDKYAMATDEDRQLIKFILAKYQLNP